MANRRRNVPTLGQLELPLSDPGGLEPEKPPDDLPRGWEPDGPTLDDVGHDEPGDEPLTLPFSVTPRRNPPGRGGPKRGA